MHPDCKGGCPGEVAQHVSGLGKLSSELIELASVSSGAEYPVTLRKVKDLIKRLLWRTG